MSQNFEFPVFLWNKIKKEILVSTNACEGQILDVNEVYDVIVDRKQLDHSLFSDLIFHASAKIVKLRKQLSEIKYRINIQLQCAEVRVYCNGLETFELTLSEFILLRRIGYYIANNKCFPFDQESLDFSFEIFPEGQLGSQISLNSALNFFSKRHSLSQIEFDNKEFNLHQLISSNIYTCSSSLFLGKLYGYQEDGFSWLIYCCVNRLGGILADDMGLGKTIQIIALIAVIIEKHLLGQILIVVPGTLLENWRREFESFLPSIIPYIHHGNDRRGSPAFLRLHKVVITSYSMIINDQYLFNKIRWGLTILDEGSLIKNPESQRRISIGKLESDVKIVMTGTPIENSLLDLWSIVDYVRPGYLGSVTEFTNKYITRDVTADIESGKLLELKGYVSYIMLRRKKEEVLESLPQKIDIHQALVMHDKEAREYENKKSSILSSNLLSQSGTLILKLIMELRMFTTHPLLVDGEIGQSTLSELKSQSYKFCRLLELVHEIHIRKEKVLIFTEFLGMIDTLQRVLSLEFNISVFTIDGRINILDRQRNIDLFFEKVGFSVMVINPRTGGMGLNITAANHVIHYTRQWNPALEQQASARAYRNGQKRSINIYYLYYIDTIEEVIDERLRIKLMLSDEVITVTEFDDVQEYLKLLTIPVNKEL